MNPKRALGSTGASASPDAVKHAGRSGPCSSAMIGSDAKSLAFRLHLLAEEAGDDDDMWQQSLLEKSATMLDRLDEVVTTDHETKDQFIRRVRSILNLGSSYQPRADKNQPSTD